MFRPLSETAMARQDRDYLQGAHDDEIARPGLQRRGWRPRVLDAWRRGGATTGTRVITAGGRVTKEWAERVRDDFHVAGRGPNMVTAAPMVLEVIAEKA
jgi:hypothetical protein